ncbi:signal peptidase I [Anaeromicrobium sediminis]|uniref:Signal peptidase I n=1 Tax=Anaeromicrobium sediminis TaxID=1478221 RepID=A0A267MH55_9FIRM|nr:signal peptidase I [Anaeromicrobium sediminis]PAB58133.1 signal peptidase I [Anaeromicrobium sediminis]
MKKEIMEWIKSIGLAIVIALVVTSFVTTIQVYSVSMNPTLVEGDKLILLNSKSVEYKDIVVVNTDIELSKSELKKLGFMEKLKGETTKKLIKRVIATEGDKLVIKDGDVYVNDVKLDEDYIKEPGTWPEIEIDSISENQIFVMGDNRNNSMDSRQLGPIDKSEIVGKALIRIYPFSKFGTIKAAN